MPRKKKISPKQLSLLEAMGKSVEARETIKVMLAVKKGKNVWRGLVATPPGSLLETVIEAFRKETDIPLEIPFFVTLHFLAAHLLKRGVKVDFVGSTVKPDLWTVILADSGSGKTFATNRLEKIFGVNADFPEPSSSAKFVEILRDHNNSLWIRDEFAQFLKALEQQTYLVELKDYLLRVYDGKKIERNTKKESIIIEDPAICCLGLTVLQTFKNSVGPESMVDGFAQRYSYVIAWADPSRPAKDYPIYDLREHSEKIKDAWDAIIDSVSHKEYIVTKEAENAFRTSFSMLLPPKNEIPLSFFRRIMFRGVRYALLYHVLMKKQTPELDAYDFGWAGRICGLHVQDAAWLVGEHGLPDLERMCLRGVEVKARVEETGRKCTPRDLVQNVHGIRSANEARSLLELISDETFSLPEDSDKKRIGGKLEIINKIPGGRPEGL